MDMIIQLKLLVFFAIISRTSQTPTHSLGNALLLSKLLSINYTEHLEEFKKSITIDRLSEDGKLNFTGLAIKYGFHCEEHEVVTSDGYVLTVFRIPGDERRPVLLAHGTTPTADCWMIRGESSLAAALARRKYDVWAINLRGTRYSRKNIHIDPDKEPNKFFNITFYDQGVSDVPETIDYILDKTSQQQLAVISHSQGTTSCFVMAAELPEYNEKVKLFIALAPIVFLENAKGTAVALALLLESFKNTTPETEQDGGLEILGHEQVAPLLQGFCLASKINMEICRFIIFTITGPDRKGFDSGFFTTFLGHFPGGTTTKNVFHAVQLLKSNRFERFDYGREKNLMYYHSEEPPEIDLRKVKMNTALLVGKGDILATPKDAERLKDALPNVVQHLVLPYEKFNHIDFVYGSVAEKYLFPYVFELLDKYE